jgi:hypothetical protein
MSKKRRPGRPRKVGRPRLKRRKHKRVGRPRRVGRPKIKNRRKKEFRQIKKRKYHHKLDISVLYNRFKKNRRKIKDRRITQRRDSSSYDASCYGSLSCDGKPNIFTNDLALAW